jgi:hypothetical protein
MVQFCSLPAPREELFRAAERWLREVDSLRAGCSWQRLLSAESKYRARSKKELQTTIVSSGIQTGKEGAPRKHPQ